MCMLGFFRSLGMLDFFSFSTILLTNVWFALIAKIDVYIPCVDDLISFLGKLHLLSMSPSCAGLPHLTKAQQKKLNHPHNMIKEFASYIASAWISKIYEV